MSIEGRSILVTRPCTQARGLLDRLKQLKAHVIPVPMIDISPIPRTPETKQSIIDLDRFDAIICVSSNAAELGTAMVEDYWPQLPAHIRWYGVGQATASALERFGIRPFLPAVEATSEGLLALNSLHGIEGQRVLIMKGEGGRELLYNTLRARGAEVTELVLYRRVNVAYSRQQLTQLLPVQLPDAIIVTSVAILDAMHRLLAPCYRNLISVNLVAASQRIADAARDLGYQRIILAAGASDQAVIGALHKIEWESQ